MGYSTTGSVHTSISHEQQIGLAAAEKWRAKAQKRVEDAQVDTKCIWAAMRSLLPRSNVVAIAAGEVVLLSASAVLVRGSVEVSKHGVSSKGSKGDTCVKAVALSPCVLVWSEYVTGAVDKATKVPLRAGVALLLRCVTMVHLNLPMWASRCPLILVHMHDCSGAVIAILCAAEFLSEAGKFCMMGVWMREQSCCQADVYACRGARGSASDGGCSSRA